MFLAYDRPPIIDKSRPAPSNSAPGADSMQRQREKVLQPAMGTIRQVKDSVQGGTDTPHFWVEDGRHDSNLLELRPQKNEPLKNQLRRLRHKWQPAECSHPIARPWSFGSEAGFA